MLLLLLLLLMVTHTDCDQGPQYTHDEFKLMQTQDLGYLNLRMVHFSLFLSTSDDSSMTHRRLFHFGFGQLEDTAGEPRIPEYNGIRSTPPVPSRFGSKLPHLC